jgi:hypothetical protein
MKIHQFSVHVDYGIAGMSLGTTARSITQAAVNLRERIRTALSEEDCRGYIVQRDGVPLSERSAILFDRVLKSDSGTVEPEPPDPEGDLMWETMQDILTEEIDKAIMAKIRKPS